MSISTPESLIHASELFKAFAEPVRLRILTLLAGGEVCVRHLHEALELPRSTVSRHLAYLRTRGIVVGEKRGLWVHYRLAKAQGELHRKLLGCLDGPGSSDWAGADRRRLDQRPHCES